MCIGTEGLASDRPTDTDSTVSRRGGRLPPPRVPGMPVRKAGAPGRPHAERPSAGCRER